MGYQGVWVIKEAIQWLQAVWDIRNTMGYEGVWVILGMCYKGVYCTIIHVRLECLIVGYTDRK